MIPVGFTDRWTSLRPHREQYRFRTSRARFCCIPAGRRSGKTEISKRRRVERAILADSKWPDWRAFCGAPTRDQAKRIFWSDLKAMVPKALRPSYNESAPFIEFDNFVGGRSQIWVIGLDKPARMEGTPWNDCGIDEFGNVKEGAWGENIRPALSDRMGTADLTGVPEGRNHYYRQWLVARADEVGEWGAYHWKSAEILPASEIESARRTLDELTFDQEYNASFLNFTGRAYYAYDEKTHEGQLAYDADAPLIFCFDFNVAPGIAVVCQEQPLPTPQHERATQKGMPQPSGTGIIGEVYIPQNSNTERVCAKLVTDWGAHRGRIECFGDSTGGARGSAKVAGSDWDLIRKSLGLHFGARVSYHVATHNPPERSRVNAVNSRLLSATNTVRMMLDPRRAPRVKVDFEGVRLVEGGSGEIDKDGDKALTHLSDALGYYVHRRFPAGGDTVTVSRLAL
jgi:hypothetical protein